MALWALVAATLTVLVLAVLSFLKGSTSWSPIVRWATSHKDASGWGGDIVANVLFAAAPLALGFAAFLALRFGRVTRRYARLAKEAPTELVQTAGSIVGEVVGRDDLCTALQTELRTKDTRRPHVLVGGLGVGKTAVLVQLTYLLARRGAVPVPVRLRDVAADEDELDFLELARRRFQKEIRPSLRSEGEGDKVWKQLLKDDRIVVLADGLEEAFADADGRARDHRVRVGIRRAAQAKYPLIVASRPHDALRALDAAITHLEPLSEDAALDYVRGAEPALDETVADRLINTAEITEAPLYLRIARELNAEDLLGSAVSANDGERMALRSNLVEAWLTALTNAGLRDTERLTLDEVERTTTVDHLTALALVGLLNDTQQVTFDRWDGYRDRLDSRIEEELERHAVPDDPLHGAPIVDVQAAASNGCQLGLVDPIRNGVRFPHSIMQAFLGARVLDAVIEDERLTETLREALLRRPGRELLLALTVFARKSAASATTIRHAERVLELLLETMGELDTNRSENEHRWLDIAAAAIEIDAHLCVRARARRTEIQPARPNGDLVAELMASSGELEVDIQLRRPAASALATAGGIKPSDGVLAVARRKGWPWRTLDDTTRDAKRNLVHRVGDAARSLEGADAGAMTTAYQYLYEISVAEHDYALALAAAQEIGDGGDGAWAALHGTFPDGRTLERDWMDWTRRLRRERDSSSDGRPAGSGIESSYVTQAWLLPMLLGSGQTSRPEVDSLLDEWIRYIGSEDSPMPLSVEAALAQGFKHAANRRPHHSHEKAEARRLLQKHARTMIAMARFWYARLSLVHALCLWEIARLAYPGHLGHELPDRPADAHAVIAGWLRRGGRHGSEEERHRFVREAADLAQRALETRQPERFLWIDECGIVGTVGARARNRSLHAADRLWIMPSAGWMALDDQACELVADVLIVLNLAERGGDAEQRERGLQRANAGELPLCISSERVVHLRPADTAGQGDIPNPGQTCKAHCRVGLCPYPPRGRQPYRDELSEGFCRRQVVANRFHLHRRNGWQRAPRVEMRRFWTAMERRART